MLPFVFFGQENGEGFVRQSVYGFTAAGLNTGATTYGSTYFGYSAGNNSTGTRNTFVGILSGYKNTTGINNVMIGDRAGLTNTTGRYNTFLGTLSGYKNTTGNHNTFSGMYSGFYNTTGLGNTFLGYQSGFRNSIGHRNVMIGFQAGYFETTSNKLYIDNSATRTPLIYGDFDTNELTVNGDILSNKLMLNDPNLTSDWNSIWQSGFYESLNATNGPESNGWFWGLNMNHRSNSSTYKYNGQIAIKNSSTSPTMYFRSTTLDGTGTWAKIIADIGNKVIISGNVGIGATNPAYKLHVDSGVQLRKTTIGATLASAENSWIRDDWLTGCYGPPKWNQATAKWVRPGGTYNDVGGIIYQDEGTYFIRDGRGTKLEYTNNEFLGKAFMFADINNGNLGIGTNTPDSGYKLTVKGKIWTREVKVTSTAGGADFVFENTYKLPTLEEVEQFITENKHLPEIASAKEMEENGIHLAEMNIKLLQKIEELTLYTIQQQKELEAQQKEIEAQHQKNKSLEARLEALEAHLKN